ncbi:MAG: hypothetical protein MZV64_13465 [Ignavibacteriales bacterium]|nr:hypothetical protein [Ignavibacteriales bacterium]
MLGAARAGRAGHPRDDGGAAAGVEVPVYYDPLIAKLGDVGRDAADGASPGWRAPSTSTTSAASRRRSRSSAGCWPTRTSRRGRFDTTFIDRALAGAERAAVPRGAGGGRARRRRRGGAAGIHRGRRRAAAARPAASDSRWQRAARTDGLRQARGARLETTMNCRSKSTAACRTVDSRARGRAATASSIDGVERLVDAAAVDGVHLLADLPRATAGPATRSGSRRRALPGEIAVHMPAGVASRRGC